MEDSRTPGETTVRTTKTLLVVALVVLSATACQGYRNDQNRTPGEFADDVYIQAAVKTALIRDAEISGMNLNVEVRKGVVTLYGGVPDDNVRARAVDIAGKVTGVNRVDDKLTVVAQ